jgi:putative membrane protein
MAPQIQVALEGWSLPVLPTLAVLLAAGLYLRGWLHLRSRSVSIIPVWRAWSFLAGMFLIWVALGSPLAAFDEELLTIHMVQHLLLMTIAPPLILLGAPMMPLLHGLPQRLVQSSLAPLLRWAPVQRVGHMLGQPVVGWLAGAAALVGWHIPAAFTLGLQSEAWHVVEHGCFLASGFLFWWPVIQPWPSVPTPRWSMLVYLFLATLPCDILSAFLAFCDRVVYSIYLSTPRHFGISALQDQQCAGALMWTCVTFVYLLAATAVTARLLARPSAGRMELLQPELHRIAASEGDSRTAEVA